ncbi:MAG: hypothetical protein LUD81_02040, partial [Clostridiales bacterium]|nr:hypothetical protein [Clostridiales bacterium]
MAKNQLTNDEFLKGLMPEREVQNFGHNDYERYARIRHYNDILSESHYEKQRSSNVAIFGLSRGHSAAELMNMTAEQKQALGREYLDFYNDNIKPGLTADPNSPTFREDTNRMIASYGQMYGNASRQLLEEKIPPYERGRMHKLSEANKDKIETLKSLTYDLREKMHDFETGLTEKFTPHYSAEDTLTYTFNFGGRKEVIKKDEELRVSTQFFNFMQADMDISERGPERNHNNPKLEVKAKFDDLQPRTHNKTITLEDMNRAAAQAEAMAGGRCLSELGGYNGRATLGDFSKVAEKAGMDAYKIEAASKVVFEAAVEAVIDPKVHT